MSSNDFGFSIDLTVRNEWKNIDLLRTSVQNCFIAVFADLDGCHAIAMITGELLENALKYGHWTTSNGTMFRLRVVGHERHVEVSVQNPIQPGSPHAKSLLGALEWIDSYPKPEQAYRARMLQIAQDDTDASPSGLGLVRIAFEGNCRLTASVEHEQVTVTAIMQRE